MQCPKCNGTMAEYYSHHSCTWCGETQKKSKDNIPRLEKKKPDPWINAVIWIAQRPQLITLLLMIGILLTWTIILYDTNLPMLEGVQR